MSETIDEICPRCKGFVWHRREPCNCAVMDHTARLRKSLLWALGCLRFPEAFGESAEYQEARKILKETQ